MTGFVIGFVMSAPIFAYLGYRYGSKSVSAGVTIKAGIDQAEAQVKKDL